jgi:hypothetical protein
MSRRVAVVQSSYIPWKGYFDLIGLADCFVLFDEVQYTKADWRNRNRIKTAAGPRWLTIPVLTAGRHGQAICEATAAGGRWRGTHWRTLAQSYGRAPFFDDYAGSLESLYLEDDDVLLTRINERFIRWLCDALGVATPIIRSSELPGAGDRVGRLVAICAALGADAYLSGPRARSYLDERRFEEAGIALEYMDYGGYPPYPQLHGPFVHQVSALDLLFAVGGDAAAHLECRRRPEVIRAG